MNKRPLASGLPAKPTSSPAPPRPPPSSVNNNNNNQHNQGRPGLGPGPAPPLPAGPPPPPNNVNVNVNAGSYGVGPQAYPGAIAGGQPGMNYQQQQQQQQQGGQAVDPAAHAAAWAAYYAGQPNPYAAATGAITPTPNNAGAAGGNQAYANYGYGVGTAHANHVNPQQQQPQQPQQAAYGGPGYQYPTPAGPTPPPFRPPGAGAPPQGQYPGAGYQQQPGQYYPQPPAGPPQPQMYGSPAAPMPMTGPYQPQPGQPPLPQQPPPNQPYFPGNQYNQQSPATRAAPMAGYQSGPGAGGQGFRPGLGPQGQAQNRPYSPRPPQQGMGMQGGMGMGMQGGPGGAPINMMGMSGGTPPAKRPRFDNSVRPGMGGPSGPGAGMGMNARPSNGGPSGPGAYTGGRPPQGMSGSTGPAAAARPPIVRPPIHLGMGGPPPPGMGITPRATNPVSASAINVPRPGMRGRDRPAHSSSKAPVVSVPGAPRGPSGKSGLRASAREASGLGGKRATGADERERDRKKRERERDARENNERESVNGNVKATMTDFRIVGMEMKGTEGLVWKWGLTGDEAVKLHPVKEEEKKAGGDVQVKEEVKVDADKAKDEGVKSEEQDAGGATLAPGAPALERSASGDEEERSRKRKADSPENEEGAEGSHKKRAAHEPKDEIKSEADGGADAAVTTEAAAEADSTAEVKQESDSAKAGQSSAAETDSKQSLVDATPNEVKEEKKETPRSKYEENQNRFRIYFESPAELDRIPKALRRGNKRWRRESTAPRGSTPVPSAVPASAAISQSAAPAETVEAVEVVGDAQNADPALDVAASGAEVAAVAEVEPEVVAVPAEGVEVQGAELNATEGVEAVAEVIAGADATVNANGDAETVEEEEEEEEVEEVENVGDVSMASATAPALEQDIGVDVGPNGAEVVAEVAVVSTEAAEAGTVPAEAAFDGVDGQTGEGQADGELATAAADAPATATATETEAETRERERAEREAEEAKYLTHQPSTNRISILYEESSRRICLDADVISKVRIYREDGRIEVDFKHEEEQKEVEGSNGVEGSEDCLKGILVEVYDNTDERFVPLTSSRLDEIHSAPVPDAAAEDDEDSVEDRSTVPPLHKPTRTLTVWLNKRRPLSEPKWLRSDNADEWLYELFVAPLKSASVPSEALEAWRGKLQVVDPDPVPTLSDILGSWANTCSMGKLPDRQAFTASLLADPADLLEILLRLARGDRNPSIGGGNASGFGALASGIRHDSPYASHQTHVSLAVLQMYRLTMAYAKKAMDQQGEDEVKEKMEDIVKSLPVGMIQKSLDGLFREWGEKRA